MSKGRQYDVVESELIEGDMVFKGWVLALYKDETQPSGYKVLGHVKGKDNQGSWRVLSINKGTDHCPYWQVKIPPVDKKKNDPSYLLLHKYVFAYCCGWKGMQCSEGKHVHHKDGNKLNNDIDNLLCMDENEHKKLHGIKRSLETFEKERLDKEWSREDALYDLERREEMGKILAKAEAIKQNSINKKGRELKDIKEVIKNER